MHGSRKTVASLARGEPVSWASLYRADLIQRGLWLGRGVLPAVRSHRREEKRRKKRKKRKEKVGREKGRRVKIKERSSGFRVLKLEFIAFFFRKENSFFERFKSNFRFLAITT